MAQPAIAREEEFIPLLLQLTLNPKRASEFLVLVQGLTQEERDQLLVLADAHHVVIRSCEALLRVAEAEDAELSQWLQGRIAREKVRIARALGYLSSICSELEAAGCPAVVMKSLDHWPDLGNDLDLYSSGNEGRIRQVMQGKVRAELQPPSWGDRLAHKLNFAIPGLPELVEIHVQRLGQTGEHREVSRRFVDRRVFVRFSGYGFFVPAPEERVIVATLQRMYRHFYARVCDIANTAQLVEAGEVDFDELRRASESAKIWPGVATYLTIVSDYVARYRGVRLNLPAMVNEHAQFGGERVAAKRRFLRIPIWPQGTRLYFSQLRATALGGEAAAALRLSLLPGLASAAAVADRLTGSDKGIW